MNDYNIITVVRENFASEQEWRAAVSRVIFVLLENRQIMTVDEEESGIVVINYNYADRSIGCRYPYWLSSEEIESIIYSE